MIDHDDIMLIETVEKSIQQEDGWVLKKIDAVIQESVEKHAALIALDVGRQLKKISEVSGLALAKLIYGMQANWGTYQDVNDNFVDTVSSYIGLHIDNVPRYANVWALFAENVIPEELREDIQQRSIKDLIPIGAAINQGYEIEPEAWGKIAGAPDYNTVLQVIREDVKQKPPKSGSMQLYLDRDGTIWAFRNEQRKFVGSLEMSDEDETVQKAANRIISGAGIIVQ